MSYQQIYFSVVLNDSMTVQEGMFTAVQCIEICEQLELTGRIFSDGPEVMVVLEGDAVILDQFIRGAQKQTGVGTLSVIQKAEIDQKEYSDFSIWLNFSLTPGRPPRTHIIATSQPVHPLPKKPSVRLQSILGAVLDNMNFGKVMPTHLIAS